MPRAESPNPVLCLHLWINAREKSLDEEESLYEHVAEQRECGGRLGAQPNKCGSQAPGVSRVDGRFQADGQVLDRRIGGYRASKKDKASLRRASVARYAKLRGTGQAFRLFERQ